MSAKKQLNDFRLSIKEQICNILTDTFKELNDGLLPNWEEDEEIHIEADEIGKHLKINVEVGNTCYEEWVITAYVVSLDYNLYFHCEDDNGIEWAGGYNEIEWTEVCTDDLVGILNMLENL